MPGLWRHVTRTIQLILVLDDFGVKYVGQEHSEHITKTIKKNYEVSEYWEGKLLWYHPRLELQRMNSICIYDGVNCKITGEI